MKKIFSLLIIAGASLALAGCNTMDGIGEDVENAGDGIQNAAD